MTSSAGESVPPPDWEDKAPRASAISAPGPEVAAPARVAHRRRFFILGVSGVVILAVAVAGITVLTGGASTASSSPARQSASTANGEASKRPVQILADVASALRAARGYQVQGAVVDGGHQLQVRLLASGSSVQMTATIGDATYEVLNVPPAFYVRANANFWTAHLGARSAVLANRWIDISRSGLSGLGNFAPATMARCVMEDHGTLSREGSTTVDGRAAILITDAGNLPGTQPGTLAVATTGPPYPLRLTGTGHQRPGGRIDVCNDGQGGGMTGTLTFSRFNQVPPLQPPANALHGANAATL